ncbi:MAG: HNH endonuclease [Bacteroidetes bacterium]|nr:HNH endonuclease [Bacteroidota bacterium]
MVSSINKYIEAFRKIRRDRTHGDAPHKPILLISILQLFATKFIKENRIYLTPELVALFRENWAKLVTTQHDCRISYPFYYLRSDKFWHLKPKNNFIEVSSLGSLVKSFSKLNEAIDYASFDEELFVLLEDKINRDILITFLLDTYFSETKNKFNNNNGNNEIEDIEQQILKEDAVEYVAEVKKLIREKKEEEIFLRSSIFKREVPKIYNYTCCISGMRIDTMENISMVDACHIVPFSESYNDTISNGIALCPNLHRAFDRGLIGIDDDYRVIVSNKFVEIEAYYSLRVLEGKEILLPKQFSYYPLKTNFEWHRKECFKTQQ